MKIEQTEEKMSAGEKSMCGNRSVRVAKLQSALVQLDLLIGRRSRPRPLSHNRHNQAGNCILTKTVKSRTFKIWALPSLSGLQIDA